MRREAAGCGIVMVDKIKTHAQETLLQREVSPKRIFDKKSAANTRMPLF